MDVFFPQSVTQAYSEKRKSEFDLPITSTDALPPS